MQPLKLVLNRQLPILEVPPPLCALTTSTKRGAMPILSTGAPGMQLVQFVIKLLQPEVLLVVIVADGTQTKRPVMPILSSGAHGMQLVQFVMKLELQPEVPVVRLCALTT